MNTVLRIRLRHSIDRVTKSFAGHHGRIGKRGGSLPKGEAGQAPAKPAPGEREAYTTAAKPETQTKPEPKQAPASVNPEPAAKPANSFPGHEGRRGPGQYGGSAPRGQSAQTAPAKETFDPKEWQAKPMPGRKDEWNKLHETEQDNQVQAQDSILATVKDRLSFAGEWPTDTDAKSATEKRLSQIGDFIPPDASTRIKTHVHQLSSTLDALGADPADVREMALNAVDALAVQENESLGRTLGDHGTRHLLGDSDMALEIMDRVPGEDPPAQTAQILMAGIFHDIGYLTGPSQVFLDEQHPHWSQQHYDENLAPLVTRMLGKDKSDYLSYMIKTHAFTQVDWEGDPVVSAFRVADNMALFHKEKLPGVMQYVPDNVKVLSEYAQGKIDVKETQKQMVANVQKQEGLSDKVKVALTRAAKEVGPVTPKLTLGMFGGQVQRFDWEAAEKALGVTLKRDDTHKDLLKVLDLGQKQFAKLAKVFGVDPKEFENRDSVKFTDGKRTVLNVKVIGEAIKSLVLKALRR